MNPVRRLLNLLLCLVLVFNGAALAHAGAVSGHAHGAPEDVAAAPVDAVVAPPAHADAALPCHGATEADASHAAVPTQAMLDAPQGGDPPCCEDAAACDRACMPAVTPATLVPERTVPATARVRSAVPAMALQLRAPPPAHPPMRPPIAA